MEKDSNIEAVEVEVVKVENKTLPHIEKIMFFSGGGVLYGAVIVHFVVLEVNYSRYRDTDLRPFRQAALNRKVRGAESSVLQLFNGCHRIMALNIVKTF